MQKEKKKRKVKTVLEKNRDEITYNLINSALAGGLVFLGSLTQGFSWTGLAAGLIAGCVIALTKFKEYWATQKHEYIIKLFQFV